MHSRSTSTRSIAKDASRERHSRSSSKASSHKSVNVNVGSQSAPTAATEETSPPSQPQLLPTANTSTSDAPITSDPLQVAAQVYPWMYMTSTLDACFKTAGIEAKNELDTLTKQLQTEEADISDQRIRFDSERAIEFYDALEGDKEAPRIIQDFLTHGDACTKMDAEALRLGTAGENEIGMDVFNGTLDEIDALVSQGKNLQTSITEHTTSEQLRPIFSACIPVLQARLSNLEMAQMLVDSAKENLAMTLYMESMGLDEEEEIEDDDEERLAMQEKNALHDLKKVAN